MPGVMDAAEVRTSYIEQWAPLAKEYLERYVADRSWQYTEANIQAVRNLVEACGGVDLALADLQKRGLNPKVTEEVFRTFAAL
ncbi:MAG: hypothetical protein A2804_01270 [Candidatus Pacebacteria bacterium RIFCSPHIGHO2_01_FULL_46_10]|nr:MAG: hypothetical protein A2804_01270 [Candidatus Pacebacteria bacterium RIFCSPHIGHO2_01_FULL_46_10]